MDDFRSKLLLLALLPGVWLAGCSPAAPDAEIPASVCDPGDRASRDRIRGIVTEMLARKGVDAEVFECADGSSESYVGAKGGNWDCPSLLPLFESVTGRTAAPGSPGPVTMYPGPWVVTGDRRIWLQCLPMAFYVVEGPASAPITD